MPGAYVAANRVARGYVVSRWTDRVIRPFATVVTASSPSLRPGTVPGPPAWATRTILHPSTARSRHVSAVLRIAVAVPAIVLDVVVEGCEVSPPVLVPCWCQEGAGRLGELLVHRRCVLVVHQRAYSRRINIRHRLAYEVLTDERVVEVLRMWSHYEQNEPECVRGDRGCAGSALLRVRPRCVLEDVTVPPNVWPVARRAG